MIGGFYTPLFLHYQFFNCANIVVSNRANILKKDATLDELIMIGKFYGELKGKQN